MPINIEIYERTGPSSSPTDTLVTNMNWKSQSLPDNNYKYYYYPVRLPRDMEGDPMMTCSVPKYIYAKISGTYNGAKRVRWRISSEEGVDVGARLNVGLRSTYTTPTPSYQGDLSPFQPGTIVPRLSTTGPTGSPVLTPTLAANTTYYTEFLVTQFVLTDSATSVGNSNVFEVELILDEYE